MIYNRLTQLNITDSEPVVVYKPWHELSITDFCDAQTVFFPRVMTSLIKELKKKYTSLSVN